MNSVRVEGSCQFGEEGRGADINEVMVRTRRNDEGKEKKKEWRGKMTIRRRECLRLRGSSYDKFTLLQFPLAAAMRLPKERMREVRKRALKRIFVEWLVVDIEVMTTMMMDKE